jgi:hypothetical protein
LLLIQPHGRIILTTADEEQTPEQAADEGRWSHDRGAVLRNGPPARQPPRYVAPTLLAFPPLRWLNPDLGRGRGGLSP